ncbi:unnamed protein product [Nesidiocoris tenuis]|uniref:Phospholipid-transporting ATPase n=1 Tax=Nesidiocoris tenuis TaxID=355587 RepID=A0A6H5G036_9HEMI|nr:unnamed protein product [Nesidiocoris tenuis]
MPQGWAKNALDFEFEMEFECCSFWRKCCPKREPQQRIIVIGQKPESKFVPNVIRNQKYNIFTFLPLVLYEQFKFFLNFYFLLMAMTQFVQIFKVGYFYTYWGPLGFVLTATMIREAVDDIRRWKRDKEVNSQKYSRLGRRQDGVVTTEFIPSSEISVGDLIYIEKDQRVPADLLLVRTTERSGSCFIRTDQLDGETDWKFRRAIPETQRLENDAKLLENNNYSIFAEKPVKDIHVFIGTITSASGKESGLNIENTLWANTVLAAGTALGLVVYTGKETRSCMNNSQPRSKSGLLDKEINNLTKLLFGAVLALALLMIFLKGSSGPGYGLVYLVRFSLLFSYIIPLSLRVNLDFAKSFYSYQMSHDKEMPECVVRCTTIPEELGRISYLLSDKTGTLTKNSMQFKKLHSGGNEKFSVDEIDTEGILAMALCHNVTPIVDKGVDSSPIRPPLQCQSSVDDEFWAAQSSGVSYQASSPDEIALVSFAEKVGLSLTKRDQQSMQLRTPLGAFINYSILQIFPFASESKRMGIIVREESTGAIIFYMKGADVVMRDIVSHAGSLDEHVGNMATDGLRTLVMAKRILTEEEYADFEVGYDKANAVTANRKQAVADVLGTIEKNMDLICITGVEDELQTNVKETLEILRSAGIKIWMLTGDKLETAVCIAKSSNLVARQQGAHAIFVFDDIPCNTGSEIRPRVNDLIRAAGENPQAVLVITGATLEACLAYYKTEFLDLCCSAPSVVVCRCSPTQKSLVVELIRKHTKKRTAAIGDGGNDVSMIQAADVGIGIVGKEGKQASLAADFSISEFRSLSRLFLIHGRWSYKRSATLSQFIIHRGIIISVMQAIFSTVFYFSLVSLFPGFFMIGYATIFTMFPVFSLVLNKDFKEDGMALAYPNLYIKLSKGRSLSYKTFFLWVLVSVVQAGVIMYGSLLLFEDEFIHIVAIAFTALILTELVMVAVTVTTWHYLIIVAELISLALYFASLFVFRDYFDPAFLGTTQFVWKVTLITLVSCMPLIVGKLVCWWVSPSIYQKLQSATRTAY